MYYKAIEIFTGTTITNIDYAIDNGVIRFVTGRPDQAGWSDTFYTGFLIENSISKAVRKVNIDKTGEYGTLSDFRFKIENSSKYWYFLNVNDISLSGKTIKYYIVQDDTFNLVWTGTVRDDPRNEKEYEIKCIDSFQKLHKSKKFPPVNTTVSKYENVPDNYNGKPVPISIGDVPYNKIHLLSYKKTPLTPPLIASLSETVSGLQRLTLKVLPGIEKAHGFYDDYLDNIMVNINDGYTLINNKQYYFRITNTGETVFPTNINRVDWQTIQVFLDGFIEISGHAEEDGFKNWWYFQFVESDTKAVCSLNGNADPVPLKKYEDDSVKDISGSVIGYDDDYFYLSLDNEGEFSLKYGVEDAELVERKWDTGFWTYVEGDREWEFKKFEDYFTNPFKKLQDRDNDTNLQMPADAIAYTNIPVSLGMYASSAAKVEPTFAFFWKSFDKDKDIYITPNFHFEVSDENDVVTELDKLEMHLKFKTVTSNDFNSAPFSEYSIENDKIDITDLYNSGSRDFNLTPKSIFGGTRLTSAIWSYSDAKSKLKVPDSFKNLIDVVGVNIIYVEMHIRAYRVLFAEEELLQDAVVKFKELHLISEDNVAIDNGKLYTQNFTGEEYEGSETNNVYNTFRLLLEKYGGLTSSDIDYSNLQSTRSDWHVGRQITKQKNLYKYLDELCKESFVCLVPKSDGKRMLKAWRESSKTPVVHNEQNILAGSIKDVEITPIYDLYNNFTIRYHYNQFTQDYERVFAVNNIDHESFPAPDGDWQSYFTGLKNGYADGKEIWEICNDSYKKVGYANTPKDNETELDWFIDTGEFTSEYQGVDSSAFKFLKNLVEYTAYRKIKIKYSLPLTSENLGLELLDKVQFSDNIITNDETLLGFISMVSILDERIEIEVTFEPQDVFDIGNIIESGDRIQDIIESGDRSENVLEGA